MKSKKLRFALTLCAVAAAVMITLATPASAKPGYCSQVCYPQPQAGNAWCSCPPGTPLADEVLRCYGYFEGFCGGLSATIIAPETTVCSVVQRPQEQHPATTSPAATTPAAASL